MTNGEKVNGGCNYGRNTRWVLLVIGGIWVAVTGMAWRSVDGSRSDMISAVAELRGEVKTSLDAMNVKIIIESTRVQENREAFARLDERMTAMNEKLSKMQEALSRIERVIVKP